MMAVALVPATEAVQAGERAAPRLMVNEDGRRLVRKDGREFFWLADTAWPLFTCSSREEREDQPAVDWYFQTRQR